MDNHGVKILGDFFNRLFRDQTVCDKNIFDVASVCELCDPINVFQKNCWFVIRVTYGLQAFVFDHLRDLFWRIVFVAFRESVVRNHPVDVACTRNRQ